MSQHKNLLLNFFLYLLFPSISCYFLPPGREARAQRRAGGLRGPKQDWVGKATVPRRVGILVPTGTPVKLGKLVIEGKEHGVKQC